jgi:type IX secretion system substrate protein
MNKLCCLIIMFITCKVCDAQNLVPNGSFEQYSGCPNYYGQFDSALFWFNPAPYQIGGGSPDYFNQCSPSLMGVPFNNFGNQAAHSGVAYAGLICVHYAGMSNFREYIEVALTSPLIANNCYHFEMYMSLAEYYSKYTIDDIGAYLSDTIISGINYYQPLPFVPQINNGTGNYTDTLNWALVSENYTASGGENYLIIGNFKNDLNTDTVLYNNNSPYEAAYVYIDDVSLTNCTGINEQSESNSINIFPNPIENKLSLTISNNELCEISLYDIASRKVMQKQFTNSVSLNTEQLAKGLYLYEVKSKSGVIKKGKIVKD